MMKGLGCLFLLLVLAVIVGEVLLIIYLGGPADPIGGHLTLIILAVAATIIGIKLVRWRGKQIPQAMLTGRIGRAATGLIGAVLLIFPGLATGLVGLLMQLPPVQALLAGLMQKIFLVFTATAMKRMGGMGGMGGGFPGAGPGAGMTPAQMAQLQKMMGGMAAGMPPQGGGPAIGKGKGKRPPKTYDVKPE
ncbi:MAG: FxsA family protein [Planctomycetota bacterium]|nr:MAG: FxsA family protein [Planctomycetota bacterium]